jgi:hypothetical protein
MTGNYPMGVTDNDPYYDMDDEDERYCYRCNSTGYITCHCGGDLCLCKNYGEMPCPKCGRGDFA